MLITLEGLDGSGKTSVWRAIREARPEPVYTCEPTESWYGEAVARSIADPSADPLAELFLYTADHADHLARIVRPTLSDGTPVVSDRYSDSRYAYQGATLEGVVPDPVRFVKDVHRPWTIPPDLTLYFDVDPRTAAERSGATNKFEQVEYLVAVRRNYEQLLGEEPDRFHRIDAGQPLEAVIEEARRVVETRL